MESVDAGTRPVMTEGQQRSDDQDAEPPTPDGKEPDTDQLDSQSEPGSHPDPDPDGTTDL